MDKTDMFTNHPQEARIRELEAERRELSRQAIDDEIDQRQAADRIWAISREIAELY